jgi:hypothetical protein
VKINAIERKVGFTPHQKRLEKANFLWENEKMAEFYEEK